MTEHFTGAPRTDQISSAEVNSACGKVLLRKTLDVEQKQLDELHIAITALEEE